MYLPSQHHTTPSPQPTRNRSLHFRPTRQDHQLQPGATRPETNTRCNTVINSLKSLNRSLATASRATPCYPPARISPSQEAQPPHRQPAHNTQPTTAKNPIFSFTIKSFLSTRSGYSPTELSKNTHIHSASSTRTGQKTGSTKQTNQSRMCEQGMIVDWKRMSSRPMGDFQPHSQNPVKPVSLANNPLTKTASAACETIEIPACYCLDRNIKEPVCEYRTSGSGE